MAGFDWGAGLGSLFQQPTAASTGDMTQGWGAQVNPAAPAPQQDPFAKLFAGLQGAKGPAPVQPIMSGGASGPAAPKIGGDMGGTPVLNAIMQLIKGQQANQVPTLGALLGQGVIR